MAFRKSFEVATSARGTYDITAEVARAVAAPGELDGRDLRPPVSAAEWRRGSLDGRDLRPPVSAAEWRRGSIDGLAHVFVHHTSASVILCENADPSVRRDLERWFLRAVPDGDPLFEHDDEGPDDMPAHVRTILTASAVTVPVVGGRLDLGTWQGIYLWEHRSAPHRRKVTVTLIS